MAGSSSSQMSFPDRDMEPGNFPPCAPNHILFARFRYTFNFVAIQRGAKVSALDVLRVPSCP